MFNLQQAVQNWRRQLVDAGVGSTAVLDELESHLCDEIRKLESAGTPEAEAFRLAASRLGGVKIVAAEFRKTSAPSSKSWWLWVLCGSGIPLILATILFAAQFPGKPSLLLLAHTLTLTVGDILAFFAGGLGICYAIGLHRLSSANQLSLCRAAALFNQLALWLILAGLLLGVVWNAQNHGHYLSADPREIGTFCTAVWLLVFCLIWRFGRVGIHTTMLLCVGGNFIISFGWFGAGLLSHSYGIGSSWQLNAALFINLLFLAWGLIPPIARTEKGGAYV